MLEVPLKVRDKGQLVLAGIIAATMIVSMVLWRFWGYQAVAASMFIGGILEFAWSMKLALGKLSDK